MSEHITSDQWIRFFSRTATEAEKLQILIHVAACEECRNLMEGANDLRFALERQRTAQRLRYESEEAEYRAVAGIRPGSAEAKQSGSLIVKLELTEAGWIFPDDTLQASGVGRKYAMNCSDDQRELADDGDALSVLIRGDRLTVEVKEAGVHGFVRLLTGQGEAPCEPLSSETQLALPHSGPCELEIIFREE